jgi:ribosomal protein S18 acetylase RimI-like enzyme
MALFIRSTFIQFSLKIGWAKYKLKKDRWGQIMVSFWAGDYNSSMEEFLPEEPVEIKQSFSIEGPLFGKGKACEPLLRSLPEWFGIEEDIVQYALDIERLPTFMAVSAGEMVGFLTLKQHYPGSAEILVMGIRREVQRQGVGRALVRQAQDWLKNQGVEYLQVKTLGASHPDENYARTRAFYLAVGFQPLEEFSQIWDENNPCLILVKKL